MKCSRVRARLSAHLDRALPQRLMIRIDMHLSSCAECRSHLGSLRGVSELLGSVPSSSELPLTAGNIDLPTSSENHRSLRSSTGHIRPGHIRPGHIRPEHIRPALVRIAAAAFVLVAFAAIARVAIIESYTPVELVQIRRTEKGPRPPTRSTATDDVQFTTVQNAIKANGGSINSLLTRKKRNGTYVIFARIDQSRGTILISHLENAGLSLPDLGDSRRIRIIIP